MLSALHHLLKTDNLLSLSAPQSIHSVDQELWACILSFLQVPKTFKLSGLLIDVCMPSRFRVSDSVWPYTAARQAPRSLGFSRQEYCSELLCPLPGDVSDPGSNLHCLRLPALAGRFFRTVGFKKLWVSEWGSLPPSLFPWELCPLIQFTAFIAPLGEEWFIWKADTSLIKTSWWLQEHRKPKPWRPEKEKLYVINKNFD